MKILIVEDDPDILEFVKRGFEAEGYTVETATDGIDGSHKTRTNTYDLIILDYSLPQKNGFEICEETRAFGSSVPILFLSVLGDTKMKIEALGKGADDYMTKPFSFDELKARAKALLRRPHKLSTLILKVGELTLDTEKKLVMRNAESLTLTRKEYNLLEYLMRNPGIAVSRSMILEHVWSAESDPFSNTVEAHILNVRKKINTPGKKDLIRTIVGRGYILGEEDNS